jgi:ABC-type glycerol-3-phosphate transport system substrate-binding protein
MKKIVRSVLCLLLILAMVVPFAGCKKNTEVTEMTYPGQDNMTFEELQELDRQNPVTIEIYVAGMTDVPESDSAILKAIAEKTGTTIKLTGIEEDRLGMMLASGEYPDVMVINRNAMFYDYLDSGDVADIGPLLKKWAPTVYQMNSHLIDIFTDEDGKLLYLTENNDLLRPGEKHPEDATDPTREQEELPWHATIYVQYPMVKEVYGKPITTLDAWKEALDAFLATYGEDGKKYLAHTLNNTVVAPPRMLIALLENNLVCEDGKYSLKIPAALRPYMGGKEIIVSNK